MWIIGFVAVFWGFAISLITSVVLRSTFTKRRLIMFSGAWFYCSFAALVPTTMCGVGNFSPNDPDTYDTVFYESCNQFLEIPISLIRPIVND